jgi:hypothetical protein
MKAAVGPNFLLGGWLLTSRHRGSWRSMWVKINVPHVSRGRWRSLSFSQRPLPTRCFKGPLTGIVTLSTLSESRPDATGDGEPRNPSCRSPCQKQGMEGGGSRTRVSWEWSNSNHCSPHEWPKSRAQQKTASPPSQLWFSSKVCFAECRKPNWQAECNCNSMQVALLYGVANAAPHQRASNGSGCLWFAGKQLLGGWFCPAENPISQHCLMKLYVYGVPTWSSFTELLNLYPWQGSGIVSGPNITGHIPSWPSPTRNKGRKKACVSVGSTLELQAGGQCSVETCSLASINRLSGCMSEVYPRKQEDKVGIGNALQDTVQV